MLLVKLKSMAPLLWSGRSDEFSSSESKEIPFKRSTRFPPLYVEVSIGAEFSSPDEPTEDADAAADAEFSVDGPKQIGSERRVVP